MSNNIIGVRERRLLDTYATAKYQGEGKVISILEYLFGEEIFRKLDVTVRVKTFEDACEELGSEHPLVIEYKTISTRVGGLTPDIIAYLKLRIIVAALNEGWEPQFTEDEWRWYGWYYLVSKEEYDKMNDADKSRVVCRGGCNAHGGVAGSYASNALSYAYSYYGSRLAFKSEELAEYAARQFIDLFADFCFRPE